MSIGLFCTRDTVIVRREDSIFTAAKLMRVHHVGSVVVVEDVDDGVKPIGLLTDRDLVVEILAKELDAQAVTVGDVMSLEVITAKENDGVWVTLKRMRSQGIRRLPVTDDQGKLLGIVSVDDILELLVGELTDLVKLSDREKEREIIERTG
ncbi:MAG: CBS domain-containing protein [Methylococcaceae bacterium]|nr:CBS domain-containing protein [Methylococcaceae bacterium]